MTNHSENIPKSSEIRVLINIGNHFIDENNIRSVARFGKGTKIFLTNGQEIVIAVSYDRVAGIVNNTAKQCIEKALRMVRYGGALHEMDLDGFELLCKGCYQTTCEITSTFTRRE